MFGFGKKRIFKKIEDCIFFIRISVATHLKAQFMRDYAEQQAKLYAAAVCNRLFAQAQPPACSGIPAETIDRLAAEFLRTCDDEELPYSIIMSLRSRMVIETDRGDYDATGLIEGTIQWIKGYRALPPDTPNPETLERLAVSLHEKYVR